MPQPAPNFKKKEITSSNIYDIVIYIVDLSESRVACDFLRSNTQYFLNIYN